MRDNIILVGTNHTRASISIRERLALSPETVANALASPPPKISEVAILSTCNRTEVYAVAAGRGDSASTLRAWISDLTGVALPELLNSTYALSGHDAVTHLFRVASGLDSMVLGEPHILGQVRNAFELAMNVDAAGPVLSRLGQDAIHAGKTVRTQTGLARSRLSIPHAAVDLAARYVGCWSNCRAVVIGAGEMGALTAKVLRSSGVSDLAIVNRDECHGRSLASTVQARFAPLGNLMTEVKQAQLVVSAVTYDGFILGPNELENQAQPLVAVDLGVPRTIDPQLRIMPGVRLFDVDDLEQFSADRRDATVSDTEKAELLIEEARDAFLRWWAARASAPAIADLSAKAEGIREAELKRALRKLAHLSERDRNVVASLSVGIVNKLLHAPITNMRGSLDGGETAEAVRRLFALEPALSSNGSHDQSEHQSRVAEWVKGR